MLGGFLTFSTLYALPSPEQIIQIQKSFESKNKLEKSKYLTTIFDLSTNLKNAGREKEYESLILQLANEKFYKSISPAIKIHLKYENLEEAENLNKIYKNPEHSYILGRINFKKRMENTSKEKAYKHFQYAASKGHIRSIKFLKENFSKARKTEKEKHEEKIKYFNIYKKYNISKTLKDLKENKVENKNIVIKDLKLLSKLHYIHNLRNDNNIDLIRKHFKINTQKNIIINHEEYD